MEKNALTELEELTLNSQSRSFLRETSKWTFFLSVIGFIGIGLMMIFSFFMSTLFGAIPEYQQMPFDFGMIMGIVYFVIALLSFFPVYYLMKFSRDLKNALITKNNETLAKAFEMLKSHYKFIGIFTIIMLSMYALIFIFGILGVIAS